MLLTTPVSIPPSSLRIHHEVPLLLLGSCFTDEVGGKLRDAGFDMLCNPFGTLYNPLSIATCLQRAEEGLLMTADELVCYEGVWHSWLHHSRFSHSDRDCCLALCNGAIRRTHDFLKRKPILLVTFGTAWVYYHRGSVVANCHKLPPQHFERCRLTTKEIVDRWVPLVERLSCSTLFTVSPIRHLADGAHGNQLSKATLLLAVDSLLECCAQTGYFDSYELLMDELRDYRFYARDMCHPSEVAIEIVWERFQETYMSPATRQRCREMEKKSRMAHHRPIIGN